MTRRKPEGKRTLQVFYMVGLVALAAACSKSSTAPAGPAATPGALVIKIEAAGSAGCNGFSPDSTSAPFTQQVQWFNTTSDTVSMEQDGTIFASAAPGEYSVAATLFNGPGVLQYGAASCPGDGQFDTGYAEIVFTSP